MATEYTVSLGELLKDALVELPGVVRSVAERELLLTMQEFFDKTFVWTKVVKDVAPVTGENPIQVDDGDPYTRVTGILAVAIGRSGEGYTPLRPIPSRPYNESTVGGLPSHFYITSNPDEFGLYPYMDNVGSYDLTVEVALSPLLDISSYDTAQNIFPRQIIMKYYDAIMQGFLARMYGHPNKPYSAPAVAGQLRHNFLRAIGYHAAQRKTGYNNSQNWRFPTGWRK